MNSKRRTFKIITTFIIATIVTINPAREVIAQTTVYITYNSGCCLYEDSNQGNQTFDICVGITNPDPNNSTTVDLQLESSSMAIDGTDIQSFGTKNITFAAGNSAEKCFTVTVIDDSNIEGYEALNFELVNVAGGNSATVGTNDYGGIFYDSITDDDNTFVEFSTPSNLSFSENADTLSICASIINASTANATVVEIEADGCNGCGVPYGEFGTDYKVGGQTSNIVTLTFPLGSTADECFTLIGIDDTLSEGDETAVTYINNVTGGNYAEIGNNSYLNNTITDDEAPPTTVFINYNTGCCLAENPNQGQQSYNICVGINDPDPNNDTTVDLQLESSSVAIDSTDIQSFGTKNITFPAGNNTEHCFTVAVLDDSDPEGYESLIFELANVGGGNFATIGTNEFGGIYYDQINDDDNTIVEFSTPPNSSFNENAGTLDICASITNASMANPTTVVIEANGCNGCGSPNADFGVDYEVVGQTPSMVTLTFPANSSADQCFTLMGIDDTVAEGNESVDSYFHSISGGDFAEIGNSSYVSNIINDDDGPQIEFSNSNPGSIFENGSASICVSMSFVDTNNDNYVEIALTGGTATEGLDFNYLNAPFTLYFPAGDNSDKCFNVVSIDDALYEGTEDLTLEITNVYGGLGGTGTNSSALLSILDNEPISCWDSNGNGLQDTSEDLNGDGLWNTLDCQGLSCWDLNGDGINDNNEDINQDGNWDALDCMGTMGTAGTNGINCWDLNGDGINDSNEDINQDGNWDALDCVATLTPDGNGMYDGNGTTPSNTTVTITDVLNFDGDIAISGTINGLSDERLKTQKAPLENASVILSQLIATSYLFDTERYPELNLSDKKQYGLLAQEVEKILPELVTTTRIQNETFKAINYNALISILVGGVNEQKSELGELKKQLQSQQNQLDIMNKKIDELSKG